MSGTRIYAASRASVPERPRMWKALREIGATIISSWIDEAGEGETDSFTELWLRIEREIAECDVLVLYVEPTDFPLKGALVEVGMALGKGKSVRIVCPGVVTGRNFHPIGSWALHPDVTFASDIYSAVGLLEGSKS